MKRYKLVFSILLLLLCKNINSQTIRIFGYKSGLIPADSVLIGFDDNATMGIDEALGEIDITDTPIDSFDLRVIQRTAEDFECLFDENAEPIQFSSSFESKVNLRPLNPSSEIDNSLYFEIKIYTRNFEGGYLMLFNDYVRNPLIPIEEYFLGFNSTFDCDPNNNMFLGHNIFDAVPSFTIPGLLLLPSPLGNVDDLFTHLYFKLERDITTNTEEPITESLKIYPNPADEFINVEGYDHEDRFYQLYNAQGQLVKQGDLMASQTKIGTVDLPAGSYVLKLLSSDKNSGKNHRIIIQ